MYRTIEAILHPDGTIELLESPPGNGRRRALLTILEELPPLSTSTPLTDAEQFDAVLRAAGLLDEVEDIPADLEPLSEAEVDALWARNPGGTPLSQIIIEDREERF